MRIGFIGAGNMAAAMARGWAGAEGVSVELAFTDGGSGRAKELAQEVGGEALDGNAALAEGVDLVILAMKPAQLEEVGAEIAAAGKPVLSLLAATSLERLSEALPGVPVIRVMPNVGVEVRQGVLCYTRSGDVDPELRDQVGELLGALGTALELEDGLIDAATAVMGCSPAYLALICEALIEAAIEEGIAEDEAQRMVVETVAGTAALLRDRDAAALRESVTSPGGSTQAGLSALEEGSIRETLADGVEASLEKMRE